MKHDGTEMCKLPIKSWGLVKLAVLFPDAQEVGQEYFDIVYEHLILTLITFMLLWRKGFAGLSERRLLGGSNLELLT